MLVAWLHCASLAGRDVPLHALSAGSAPARERPVVRILVMTLGNRQPFVSLMREEAPELVTFPATNGYNRTETVRHLLDNTSMAYHEMCGSNMSSDYNRSGVRYFETWGTLANAITRYRAFKAQVEDGIEYQATIEDDQMLTSGFSKLMSMAAERYFGHANATDIVQLGSWGEGYLTSHASAKRIVKGFDTHGLITCPDRQLNDLVMPEAVRILKRLP